MFLVSVMQPICVFGFIDGGTFSFEDHYLFSACYFDLPAQICLEED